MLREFRRNNLITVFFKELKSDERSSLIAVAKHVHSTLLHSRRHNERY